MSETKKAARQQLKLAIDLRIVTVVLLLIIIAMTALWKPWADVASDRTVQVTGEATVKGEPDSYAFYPSYEFKGNDQITLDNSTKKTNEVVAKLKSLGVSDKDIKINTNSYNSYKPLAPDETELTYNASLTITVDNKELAQKVQDYLLTTVPMGTVTPMATFSEMKRKSLEATARDEATKDARKKADRDAQNLGFSVGKVKTLTDGQGFQAMPFEGGNAIGLTARDDAMTRSSLPIQVGENELNYTVTVTYYIR